MSQGRRQRFTLILTPFVLGVFTGMAFTILMKLLVYDELKKSIFESEDPPKAGNDLEVEATGRILCMVLTHPENHWKALVLKKTWGRRCDKLLLFSSRRNSVLETVEVPGSPTEKKSLWYKTHYAFHYAWKNFRDEMDWFLKADDDTFVIVDNLSRLLTNYSASDPLVFGFQLQRGTNIWLSNGSGYVLSRKALSEFQNSPCAHESSGASSINNLTVPSWGENANYREDDYKFSKCLLDFTKARLVDTRDEGGRHRFMPMRPQDHLRSFSDASHWFENYTRFSIAKSVNCCSGTAISFHHITPAKMRMLDYLLYELNLLTPWRSHRNSQ